MKKLDNKYLEPFKILKKVKKSVYHFKLSSQQKIHDIFNEVLLSLYYPPQFKSQQQPLPLLSKIVDRQKLLEVKYIKKTKVTTRGEVQFLVKQKGYSDKQNEWMSKKDLKNALDIVKKFYNNYPNTFY